MTRKDYLGDHPWYRTRDEMIIKRYQSGESVYMIAQDMHYSHQWIRLILRHRLGLAAIRNMEA